MATAREYIDRQISKITVEYFDKLAAVLLDCRKHHLLDKSAFSSSRGITNTSEWPCILFPGEESCIITGGFGDDAIPRLRFEAPKVKG
ncbi:hypothetical protein Pint_25983 [Pistacia integerrima]|uniref:Uncharacterized protein n=1 Tax=Pistacia integerrima TaxID=434235 RepID=A0ACC0YAD0_9ROSI|nr:hypothetical protein Pint_25983 [Pistacia integerrima]